MLAGVRTLLADDHPVFRAGLRAVLESGARLLVIGEAATSSQALRFATKHDLDLAIVDVVMPEHGGAALVRTLHALQPTCKILALSMLDEPVRVADMLRAGASGYAVKSQPSEQIVHAIEMVLAGIRYLAPGIAADVVDALISAAPLPIEQLTSRERDVFDLLVSGNSNAKIAAALAIASSTVEAHRRHVMHKLQARSIVDLVRVAIKHGVIGAS